MPQSLDPQHYYRLQQMLGPTVNLPCKEQSSNKLIVVGFSCSGEHKIHFIPGMIGPFLGVTLVPQPEVRNIMIPIFHDMMDWEQRKNGNFKQVT